MRSRAFILACVALGLCTVASADVIKLKNGNKIVCENAREKGEKVEYQIGDSTYAVAKSAVDTIEASQAEVSRKTRCKNGIRKLQSAPGPKSRALPVQGEALCRQLGMKQSSPGLPPPIWMQRCGRILDGGTVNVSALEELESECNFELSAGAYYVAGNFYHTILRDEDSAAEYLKIAADYAPDNPEILQLYIDTLTLLERYSEAVPVAEQLANQMGAKGLLILGRSYYFAGRREQAIDVWRLYLGSKAGSGSVDQFIGMAESYLAACRARTPRRDDSYHYYRYRRPVIK